MKFTQTAALAASLATAEAVYQGFNYGSTFTTGAAKQQADFEAEFNKAQSLQGANCFSAARLYTGIQAGTPNTPISAIPAAIGTNTQLLLGMWASAGQANFDNEIQALQSAIDQYGSAFTDLIVGISIGSEDLYRISPTGIENMSGIGAGPDVLVSYINQVRSALAGGPAANIPLGHVDTWTAWVNGSNSAVINAVDWLGTDAYPYFQTTQANGIENGNSLFFDAYDATQAVSGGKDVWITETGWPVSGPVAGQAVASVANAKQYWDDVACSVLGNINTFWYTLQDAAPDTPSPSFGIVGSDLSSPPLFDLTCPAGTVGRATCGNGASSSSSSSASSSAVTSSVSSASAPSTTATTEEATIITTPGQETYASSAVSSAQSASGTAAGSAAPTEEVTATGADGQETVTVRSTTMITVTNCPSGCSTSTMTMKSGDSYTVAASDCSSETAPAVTYPASSASSVASSVSSFVTSGVASVGSSASSVVSSASSSASPSTSACPADLNGVYQYPHLIIPVSKSNPSKVYGTQYNATVSPDESTIFNFDIPASYAGKTCSLVFLFPEKSQLETTDFTFNGMGGISVSELSAPATEATTYDSVPSGMVVGEVQNAMPGNAYVVTSHECGAGDRIAFEFMSTGGLSLEWFNDWNPSPLGAFVRVC